MGAAVLSLLVKGLALSALTLVVVGLLGRLRGVSAAARHLVCALCLTGLLLLPLLSVGLPSLRVTVPAAVVIPTPPAALAPPVRRADVPPVPIVMKAKAVPAAAAVSAPVITTSTLPEPRPVPWALLALGVYAAGMLAAVAGALRDLAAVARLRRSCAPVTEGPAADAMADAATRVGLRRPVSLLRGTPVAVPMTAGWLRPAVLIPADAATWEPERLSVALLHEAAHIRRSDYAWQIVARFACALHWCDPLAWLLARRMREEAERACDDRVLAAGVTASASADHLLGVARGLSRSRLAPAAAVPMARDSDLGRRLGALLAARMDRNGLSPRRAALLVFAVAVVLLPLAALRSRTTETSRRREEAPPRTQNWASTAPASFRRVLTDGTIVELVSVTTHPLPETQGNANPLWWHPDGTPASGPFPYASRGRDWNKDVDGFVGREVLVRVTGPGAQREFEEYWFNSHARPSSVILPRGWVLVSDQSKEGRSFAIRTEFPEEMRTATLRVGIVGAEWQRSTVKFPLALGGSTGGRLASDVAVSVLHGRPVETRIDSNNAENPLQSGVFFHVSHTNVQGEEVRWVADTVTGEIVEARPLRRMGRGERVDADLFWPGLRIGQITKIRLESRPYEWVEFRDIALRPRAAAAVAVAVAVADLPVAGSPLTLPTALPPLDAPEGTADAGRVALTAVGRTSGEGLVWWDPDGLTLPEEPTSHEVLEHVGGGEIPGLRRVRVRFPGRRNREVSTFWDVPQGGRYHGESVGPSPADTTGEHKPYGSEAILSLPGQADRGSFRFGFANAGWTEAVRQKSRDKRRYALGAALAGELTVSPLVEPAGRIGVTLTAPSAFYRAYDVRLIVKDDEGKQHFPNAGTDFQNLIKVAEGTGVEAQFDWNGVSAEKARDLVLSVRPIQWVGFRDVALQPWGAEATSAAAAPAAGAVRLPNGVVVSNLSVSGVQPDGSFAAWDTHGRELLRTANRPEFRLDAGELRFNADLQLPGRSGWLDEATFETLKQDGVLETEFGVIGGMDDTPIPGGSYDGRATPGSSNRSPGRLRRALERRTSS